MSDILSPLPGIFYQRPAPDAPAFKTEGDQVAPEDTIGLIEVMKTFIEIKAEASGSFAGYAAADATAVSPGDVLASLE